MRRQAEPRKAFIPPVAFGADKAVEFRDAEHFSEEVSLNVGASMYYRPRSTDQVFRHKSSVFRTNGLLLVAGSSTGADFAIGATKVPWIALPIQGSAHTLCEGRTLDWGQGQHAIVVPSVPQSGEAGARSIVGIEVQPDRLLAVAQGMLRDSRATEQADFLDISTPRLSKLHVGKIRFETLFAQYFAMLDTFGGDPGRVEQAGLDDMIVRTVIMMLAPHLFMAEGRDGGPDATKIREVCDYIDANLGQRITLTDLEQVGRLSTRALQYAFKSTLGVSPMQWLRTRRLEAVRQRLQQAQPGETVTTIASQYFANLGEFAHIYRAHFGELPSDTLRDALWKPLRS